MVKKKSNKNIYIGIGVLLALALVVIFSGVFSISDFDNENYITKETTSIHFNVDARTLDDDDYDIDSRGFLYNQEHIFDYYGKELKITPHNQLNFEGMILRGDWYEITYGSEKATLYSNSFEENFGSKTRYYKTKIHFDNGKWIQRSRNVEKANDEGGIITDTVRNDINWERKVLLSNGQLVISNSDRTSTCVDKEPGTYDYNYCILSDIRLELKPNLEIKDLSIESLVNGSGNVAKLKLNNEYDTFDGIIRMKIELENSAGVSETNFEDFEMKILSGENDYDLPIASFILVARSLELDIYAKQLQTNVDVGYRSSRSGDIVLQPSSYNTKLQEAECTYLQKMDSDDKSPDCYQDLFIKNPVISYKDDEIGSVLVDLQADLKSKIQEVKDLQGNLDAQADKILEVSNNLEESKQILEALNLEREEYLIIVQKLTQKNDELAEYVKQLEGNYVELIELMNRPIEDNAEILAEMDLTLKEYGEDLKEADVSNDQMIVYVSKLQDKNIDTKLLVEELSEDIVEAQEINDGLVEFNRKKNTENIILYSIIFVMLIVIIFLIGRSGKKTKKRKKR